MKMTPHLPHAQLAENPEYQMVKLHHQHQSPCVCVYAHLHQHLLCWLGHVRWIENGRILKDLLYKELIIGKRKEATFSFNSAIHVKEIWKLGGTCWPVWSVEAQVTSRKARINYVSWQEKQTRCKELLCRPPPVSTFRIQNQDQTWSMDTNVYVYGTNPIFFPILIQFPILILY